MSEAQSSSTCDLVNKKCSSWRNWRQRPPPPHGACRGQLSGSSAGADPRAAHQPDADGREPIPDPAVPLGAVPGQLCSTAGGSSRCRSSSGQRSAGVAAGSRNIAVRRHLVPVSCVLRTRFPPETSVWLTVRFCIDRCCYRLSRKLRSPASSVSAASGSALQRSLLAAYPHSLDVTVAGDPSCSTAKFLRLGLSAASE